jgi:hypothetical protein
MKRYLCGQCKCGWVSRYRIIRTGLLVWVCEECDALWLDDRRVGMGASYANMTILREEISAPPDDSLHSYVLPFFGGRGASTDWQQIALIEDGEKGV